MESLRRQSVAEADYTIVDLGWDARLEGVHRDDNPYALTSWKHYDWEKGWLQADQAEADKK